MQILIDIHEKDYQSMKNGHIPYSVLSTIMNGTPLPKGHGDLIDINDLLEQIGLEDTEENREDNVGEIITLEDIDRVDVIIQAERSDAE